MHFCDICIQDQHHTALVSSIIKIKVRGFLTSFSGKKEGVKKFEKPKTIGNGNT